MCADRHMLFPLLTPDARRHVLFIPQLWEKKNTSGSRDTRITLKASPFLQPFEGNGEASKQGKTGALCLRAA